MLNLYEYNRLTVCGGILKIKHVKEISVPICKKPDVVNLHEAWRLSDPRLTLEISFSVQSIPMFEKLSAVMP